MFNSNKFIKETIKKLQKEIKGKTLIAFSGGVDSTVCASIVNMAIGDNLIAVNVDTGYMRKNEPESIKKLMKKMKLNYRFIDASDIFSKALKGVFFEIRNKQLLLEFQYKFRLVFL